MAIKKEAEPKRHEAKDIDDNVRIIPPLIGDVLPGGNQKLPVNRLKDCRNNQVMAIPGGILGQVSVAFTEKIACPQAGCILEFSGVTLGPGAQCRANSAAPSVRWWMFKPNRLLVQPCFPRTSLPRIYCPSNASASNAKLGKMLRRFPIQIKILFPLAKLIRQVGKLNCRDAENIVGRLAVCCNSKFHCKICGCFGISIQSSQQWPWRRIVSDSVRLEVQAALVRQPSNLVWRMKVKWP